MKKNILLKEAKKTTSGITLIALVVTIVILIILATISLNLLFNKNGIIKQAQLAKEIQANAEAREKEQLDTIEEEANKIISNVIDQEKSEEKLEMTIAEAKAAVTSYETLQKYIGKKITDYNPKAGGTWRIFYYDETGEFGTAGKLYLKRDFVSNDTSLSSHIDYTPSEQGLKIMKAMNPKWRDYPTVGANTIDLENEHCVAWLCDPEVWNDNYKTDQADYAIGSPSVEMYMKAYNVWKTGNKDATNLICKVEGKNGYSVGANNTYDNSGYYTNNNTIEVGPKNIFMTSGTNYCWLASPSSGYNFAVLYVSGRNERVGGLTYSDNIGVCPIVSL